MKKRRIILIAILALLSLSAIWYMRPRTLDATIDLEGKTVTSIAMSGMFIEDSWDADGVYWPVHKSYTIDSETADTEAILDILRTSRYSRSFRSLFSPDSVSLGDVDGIITVSMVLDGKESVRINIANLVSFSLPGSDGFTVARANNSLFPLLEEYVRANGVE